MLQYSYIFVLLRDIIKCKSIRNDRRACYLLFTLAYFNVMTRQLTPLNRILTLNLLLLTILGINLLNVTLAIIFFSLFLFYKKSFKFDTKLVLQKLKQWIFLKN